jgi:hypothetical protein
MVREVGRIHQKPAEQTLGEVADEILEFLGTGHARELEEIARIVKLPVKKWSEC